MSIAKRKSILVSFYKSVVGTLFPPQESATSVQGMICLHNSYFFFSSVCFEKLIFSFFV